MLPWPLLLLLRISVLLLRLRRGVRLLRGLPDRSTDQALKEIAPRPAPLLGGRGGAPTGAADSTNAARAIAVDACRCRSRRSERLAKVEFLRVLGPRLLLLLLLCCLLVSGLSRRPF